RIPSGNPPALRESATDSGREDDKGALFRNSAELLHCVRHCSCYTHINTDGEAARLGRRIIPKFPANSRGSGKGTDTVNLPSISLRPPPRRLARHADPPSRERPPSRHHPTSGRTYRTG